MAIFLDDDDGDDGGVDGDGGAVAPDAVGTDGGACSAADDIVAGGSTDDDPACRAAPDFLDWDPCGPAAPEVPGFQIERLLGAGASAQVWLVQDEATGALLAAKCFPPSFPAPDTGAARTGTARGRDGGGRDGGGRDGGGRDGDGRGGGGLLRPSTRGSRATGRRVAGGRGTGSRAASIAAAEPAAGNTAAMMQRELRILGNYGHEHLVRLHAAVELRGPWDGGWALLMDYAPGGSLAAVVAARGRLSVGETVTVLTPLAQVLGYLHDQGVVHGDLSPGNVLFTAEGKPLLSDLGVGRMVGDAPGPGGGTPGFAAPGEAVSGLLLDPAADVYALAALGWFCLTGDPPAETSYRMPLSAYLPDVPPELAAALEAGLQESGRQRPAVLELGQAIYRSAPAVPVDLTLAVHPSVLPDLLTRRQLQDRRGHRLQRGYRRRSVRRERAHEPAWHFRRHADGSIGLRSAGHPSVRQRSGIPANRTRSIGRAVGLAAAAAAVVVLAAAGVLMWSHQDGWPGKHSLAGTRGITAAAQADPLETIAVPDGIRDKLRSDDPQLALSGLAWLRSYAFAEGQLKLLDQVNAAGSAAMAADQRISARLAASQHVLTGLETQILKSQTLPVSTAEAAVISATAVTSGFTEQDGSGAVIRAQPEAGTQQLEFVLVKDSGHWRISEVHER